MIQILGQKPIQEKRNLEKPHWVLISKEIIGRNKTYFESAKALPRRKITNTRSENFRINRHSH